MSHLAHKLKNNIRKYLRRKLRVNAQIKSHKPEHRLIVNRSNLHISAQIIDKDGNVLASINDKNAKGKTKVEKAFFAWEDFGKVIISKKIDKIAFDRNWYLYHGRVKSFAGWVRKAGVNL